MTNEDIYSRLEDVFRNVFDDDEIVLTPTTTAADVDGWDSLSNIRLILAVESAFSIRLSAAEVGGLSNLGGLVDVIAGKA